MQRLILLLMWGVVVCLMTHQSNPLPTELAEGGTDEGTTEQKDAETDEGGQNSANGTYPTTRFPSTMEGYLNTTEFNSTAETSSSEISTTTDNTISTTGEIIEATEHKGSTVSSKSATVQASPGSGIQKICDKLVELWNAAGDCNGIACELMNKIINNCLTVCGSDPKICEDMMKDIRTPELPELLNLTKVGDYFKDDFSRWMRIDQKILVVPSILEICMITPLVDYKAALCGMLFDLTKITADNETDENLIAEIIYLTNERSADDTCVAFGEDIPALLLKYGSTFQKYDSTLADCLAVCGEECTACESKPDCIDKVPLCIKTTMFCKIVQVVMDLKMPEVKKFRDQITNWENDGCTFLPMDTKYYKACSKLQDNDHDSEDTEFVRALCDILRDTALCKVDKTKFNEALNPEEDQKSEDLCATIGKGTKLDCSHMCPAVCEANKDLCTLLVAMLNYKPADDSATDTNKPADDPALNTNKSADDPAIDTNKPADDPAIDTNKDDSNSQSIDTNKLAVGETFTPDNMQFIYYALTAMALFGMLYVFYHNRKRVVGLCLEGRGDKSKRRPASKEYKNLSHTVSDVMPFLAKES